MTHYRVHLECPGLPAANRIHAEVRFAKALERALGGADAVVLAFQAWNTLSESSPEDVRAEDVTQARAWQRASDQARQAGMQELGSEEAYFEVTLREASAIDG